MADKYQDYFENDSERDEGHTDTRQANFECEKPDEHLGCNLGIDVAGSPLKQHQENRQSLENKPNNSNTRNKKWRAPIRGSAFLYCHNRWDTFQK